MRRLSQKRLLQRASRILAALAAPFAVLWFMRGLRPAIECGVLDALGSGNLRAAYACIDQADYDALVTVILLASSAMAWIASRRAPDTPIGEYHPTPVEQARNRKGMIDRVCDNWIKGRLDQSLYQEMPINLRMVWRPHRPGEQERLILSDKSMHQLFDEAKHVLLILGEPGSGKTTKMLDLASALLERARSDESTPLPVVFNLSSLAEPEQSLDDWLVGEFRTNYDVDEKYARYWLAHDELTLLLDGLDEVRADHRAGVVEKIDKYRSQHMDPWLVICCRQNEYAELVADDSALEGVDAAVLQPLTPDQIRRYLVEELKGSEPQRLWRALQDDAVLLQLADTPLMLNVMLLAAEQLDWSALPSEQGVDVVRAYIYNAYIRSMLARPRDTSRRYPDEKTLRWLHWLAGKMVEHGQTVFLLERMKRSWFNQPWQRFVWVAVFGLTGGLIYGIVGAFAGGMAEGLVPGIVFGLGFAIFFGLEDIVVSERVRLKFERELVSELLIGWPIYGLVVMLVLGLFSDSVSDLPLFFGPLIGYTLGLTNMLFSDEGFVRRSTVFEVDYRKHTPNAAIRQSLFGGSTGLLVFMISMATVFLIAWLLDELGPNLSQWKDLLQVWLLFGLLFGPGVGLYFGWSTVIKHYTLRLVLFLDGSMPLNYVRFLDYCVDRVLLRRVGGGYMFIHRTMMEHIAGLDLEKWKEQPDSP